jgi:hypothetical protein
LTPHVGRLGRYRAAVSLPTIKELESTQQNDRLLGIDRSPFSMRYSRIFISILLLMAAGGCNLCCCGKRASEQNCPTDIRKTQCWCFGEDAIFCCPCGPDSEFYGYQPTCWRGWPASGAEWRDGRCPPPPHGFDRPDGAAPREPELSGPSLPADSSGPNPFRGEHRVIASEQAAEFVGGF